MPMEADIGQPDSSSSLLAFFGSQLRKHRTAREWSQEETAKKALATGAMISYVENAKRVPSDDLARGLDAIFGTDFFTEFYPLVIKYAYPDWFLPYVELEREAISIRMFDSQVISGLLKTEDYARALLASGRPDKVDDLVAARLTRQTIFEREDRPRAWLIMDENALRRHIGGPAVMHAQLERLLHAGEEPRTVVQIVPSSVVAHPGLAGPFTLLAFAEGTDVLYVDGFSQGRTALDPGEVMEAVHAYDLLRGYALSPDASAGLIRQHMEELAK